MAYSDEVMADAPLALWELQETSGTTVTDSSGGGHNTTWNTWSTGSSAATPGFGAAALTTSASRSVTFSGNDFFYVAPLTDLDWAYPADKTFTWEVLFSWDGSAPDGWVDLMGNQGNTNWEIYLNPDGSLWLSTGMLGSPGYVGSSAGLVSASTRYHLAVTVDAGTITVYLDGSSVLSGGTSGSMVSQPASDGSSGVWGWCVGAYSKSSTAMFRGRMSHVALYDAPLSAARVAAHAAAVDVAPTSPDATTSTQYANYGYNYTGLGLVEYDPPIAATPARVRREVTRRVHQSLPAPNLVDGRPV